MTPIRRAGMESVSNCMSGSFCPGTGLNSVSNDLPYEVCLTFCCTEKSLFQQSCLVLGQMSSSDSDSACTSNFSVAILLF